MMCDGSGELRHGLLCRGCDNCRYTSPAPTGPRRPTPARPAALRVCPTCSTACGTTDPWTCHKLGVAS